MMTNSRRHFLQLTLLLAFSNAHGQTPATASLSITGQVLKPTQGQTAVFDLAALKQLPQMEIRTHTRWTEGVIVFQGPLLREVLKSAGAQGKRLQAIALNDYKNAGLDAKAANAQAWTNIKSRMNYFGKNTNYMIDFFSKKIISQWNEPTYESIWVSKVKSHTNELNWIGNGMYDGSIGQFFELYFNFYMQILFIAFAAGIYFLFINRKTNIETVLLPLVILGAFGYHLLFEGKSQYVLTYIILMIPTASFAFECILNGKYTKIKEFVGKLKEIPDGKESEKA